MSSSLAAGGAKGFAKARAEKQERIQARLAEARKREEAERREAERQLQLEIQAAIEEEEEYARQVAEESISDSAASEQGQPWPATSVDVTEFPVNLFEGDQRMQSRSDAGNMLEQRSRPDVAAATAAMLATTDASEPLKFSRLGEASHTVLEKDAKDGRRPPLAKRLDPKKRERQQQEDREAFQQVSTMMFAVSALGVADASTFTSAVSEARRARMELEAVKLREAREAAEARSAAEAIDNPSLTQKEKVVNNLYRFICNKAAVAIQRAYRGYRGRQEAARLRLQRRRLQPSQGERAAHEHMQRKQASWKQKYMSNLYKTKKEQERQARLFSAAAQTPKTAAAVALNRAALQSPSPVLVGAEETVGGPWSGTMVWADIFDDEDHAAWLSSAEGVSSATLEQVRQRTCTASAAACRRHLCIEDQPILYWLAAEMKQIALPSNLFVLEATSSDVLAGVCFERWREAQTPLLFAKLRRRQLAPAAAGFFVPQTRVAVEALLADGSLEVTDKHPYQEAFDWAISLTLLVERAPDPWRVLTLADEAERQMAEPPKTSSDLGTDNIIRHCSSSKGAAR
eukprot:TRINITY_DN18996_c0_g1_i1.p1 TRINITY_DN18996_c0_g1~~TRINITY_DN18996_c0_g1_i1.p1  ORF type:complete len:572 (+),score=150.74 TRINITY_DN18996_c0_g1_i1:98-1813(+)